MTSVIIYSRLNSSRLPGKALLKLGGVELIKLVYERARKINADDVIVATSTERTDDVLADFLRRENIKYFRGSLTDVALRTIECIDEYKIDSFVRINGDSPLFPLKELNESLAIFKQSQYQFITNIISRSFPYGYSIEIFDAKVFSSHYNNFSNIEKEHITSYFYNNKHNFYYKNIENNKPKPDSSILLTVDDKDSYEFMNYLFEVYPEAVNFEYDEIINSCCSIKSRGVKSC